ncbi:MAG: L-proline amide hydrolase [Kosmotogales bacterium]|nr:L-proline amide hydrolase [Kosmotogales bacterium]
MEECYIQTPGGRIWSCVYGKKKEKTPLLVVHGGPGFLTMTDTIKDFSSERPVYFYDQLGSGKSDRAKDNNYYSLENFIDELDVVRERLGLNEVITMGFSWGTALICSYFLQKKPTGMKKLILSGPMLSSSMWKRDQRENIKKMPQNIREAIYEGERNSTYGEKYQEAMMEYYRKHVCRMDPWPDSLNVALSKMNEDVYHTMWGPSEFTITGKLKNYDIYNRLEQINVPVLLTCGDMDEAGVKTVKDYQTAFPEAFLAVIPNSAHMHQIEQPEIYKTVVKNFLGDV